ncbi:hypothetical protein GVAMD_0450 [Gardnerella vaginalis AMD]|nr:hypothetical protein GVAMD_0450 [Gardnerella vaginalis AMD]
MQQIIEQFSRAALVTYNVAFLLLTQLAFCADYALAYETRVESTVCFQP